MSAGRRHFRAPSKDGRSPAPFFPQYSTPEIDDTRDYYQASQTLPLVDVIGGDRPDDDHDDNAQAGSPIEGLLPKRPSLHKPEEKSAINVH